MTDDEASAAALNDPDARPRTEARLAGVPPVPRTRTTRRALALTQEAFAARYPTARAYLTVIARDPDRVGKSVPERVTAPSNLSPKVRIFVA